MGNEDVILKVGIDTDDAKKKLDNFSASTAVNVSKIKTSFADMGTNVINNMEAPLKYMAGFAKEAGNVAEDIAIELKRPLSDRNQFIQIGMNAGLGVVQGLQSTKAAAVAAANNIASSIVSTMKSTLQIHSPSRVMRDMFQRDFTNGIVLGMEDGMPRVTGVTKKMCESALNAAISQSENFRDIGGNFIELMESGIDSKTEEVMATAQRAVDTIVDAAKEKDKDAGNEYSQIGKNIMSSFKESLTEGADRAKEELGERLNGIISEFKTAEKSILSEKESMGKKLGDYGSLYEEFDGKIKLSNLKDNIEVLKEYSDVLNKLKEKGASDGFLSEVTGMGVDEGLLFSEKLLSMGDTKFNEYIETWEEQQKLANSIAEDFYKEQLKILEENYLEDIKKSMADYPETMNTMGVNTMQGFIEGMLSQKNSATDAVTVIINAIKSAFTDGFDIHSPSRWAKQTIGKNIALGIAEGYEDEISRVSGALGADALSNTVNSLKEQVALSTGTVGTLENGGNLIKEGGIAKETSTNTIIKEKVVGIDCQGGFKEVARALRPYIVEENKRIGTSLLKSEVISGGI